MTKNVVLAFSEDYFRYNFGESHPLRPIRLELTYKLMEAFGLLKHPKLKMIDVRMASPEELYTVHDKEYVDIVINKMLPKIISSFLNQSKIIVRRHEKL